MREQRALNNPREHEAPNRQDHPSDTTQVGLNWEQISRWGRCGTGHCRDTVIFYVCMYVCMLVRMCVVYKHPETDLFFYVTGYKTVSQRSADSGPIGLRGITLHSLMD